MILSYYDMAFLKIIYVFMTYKTSFCYSTKRMFQKSTVEFCISLSIPATYSYCYTYSNSESWKGGKIEKLHVYPGVISPDQKKK